MKADIGEACPMLKRVHIKGFKSLEDVEVELPPLTVLFGPNAAGKSNLLDALQLLSRITTSETLADAFSPPYRGKPLESFSFGKEGIKGLLAQEEVSFSIEVDFCPSEASIRAATRNALSGEPAPCSGKAALALQQDLRYRLAIAMQPKTGRLSVKQEQLLAIKPTGAAEKSAPFIKRPNGKAGLLVEGRDLRRDAVHADRSVLSLSEAAAPECPHLAAARTEISRWRFHCFDPRESMRRACPVSDVRRLGFRGENLAAYLNTLKGRYPQTFDGLEKAMALTIPGFASAEVQVNDVGDVELHVQENGVGISDRLLSDGTLRVLGLMALAGMDPPAPLIGFEEPETGVHPRRIDRIGQFLDARQRFGGAQWVITTHSPALLDLLPRDSLRVVRCEGGRTRIDPIAACGYYGGRRFPNPGFEEECEQMLISERLRWGDFGA